MDRWIKRATLPSTSESNEPCTLQKRPRTAGTGCTVVTFNANSLFNRLKDTKDKADIDHFIETVSPDIVAVQEVRMPARAFSSSAKKNDGSRRDRTKVDDSDKKNAVDKVVMDRSFPGYKKYYSLADWRYAGTMVAVNEDGPQPRWVAYNFASAERLSKTSHDMNDDVTGAGVECSSGAADKDNEEEVYDKSQVKDGHYADGRVICLGFPSFDLLATYAANNGSNEVSFERRRKWDNEIKLFLSRASERGRAVIWVGDLNVAHTAADVTHPSFYKAQCPQQDPDDSGQPGYTPNERTRFADILSAANLVDTFRQFNELPEAAFNDEIVVHANYRLPTTAIGTNQPPTPAPVTNTGPANDVVPIDDVVIMVGADKVATRSLVTEVTETVISTETSSSSSSSTSSAITVAASASIESSDASIANISTSTSTSTSTVVKPETTFVLGPNFTWRGAAGTTVAEAGRFYGKGMRIDYALVSASLLPLVESVCIYGSGKEMSGFLGSDHCPVILKLKSC